MTLATSQRTKRMPIAKKKISYLLDIEDRLRRFQLKDRKKVKEEVAEVVLEAIETHTQASTSPVDGSAYEKLSKKYAEKKRAAGAGDKPDLHLTGSMMDSLIVKFGNASGPRFAITDPSQKKKAYNHNTGDTVPPRPFLPDDEEDETFNDQIMGLIDDKLSELEQTLTLLDLERVSSGD